MIPSTPGAPLLRTPARNAASMFSGSQIASIRYAVDAGFSGSEVAMTTSASRTIRRGVSPRPGVGKSNSSWDGGRFVVMRRPSYLPFPSTPCGDRSGLWPPKRPTTPSADFCTAVREPCGALGPSGYPWDTTQISWGKPRSLPRTPAGFTVQALDGYGLRDFLPARPTRAASYPVAVRQVAISFHASFRRSLAVPPLRFTPSPRTMSPQAVDLRAPYPRSSRPEPTAKCDLQTRDITRMTHACSNERQSKQ